MSSGSKTTSLPVRTADAQLVVGHLTCLLQAAAFHRGRLPVAAARPLPANAADERVAQRIRCMGCVMSQAAQPQLLQPKRNPVDCGIRVQQRGLSATHCESAARVSMMRLTAATTVGTGAESMLPLSTDEQAAEPQCFCPRPPTTGGPRNLGTLLARHRMWLRMWLGDTWPPAAWHFYPRTQNSERSTSAWATVPERVSCT